jgi:hypothetical protein
MINLTPHDIIVRKPDGTDTVFKKSGTVARVEACEEVIGTCQITGAQIVRRTLGAVTGLPTDGAPCIVSGMVLEACKGMTTGVFAPDTGATAIRDEKGHIVAVTRLVAA